MMLCIFIQCSISIGKEKDTTNQSALWFFLFYITVPWGLIDFLMKIKKKGKMWFPYHRIVGSVRGTSSYCKNTTCCRKCIDILKKKKPLFYSPLSFHRHAHSLTLSITNEFNKHDSVLYSNPSGDWSSAYEVLWLGVGGHGLGNTILANWGTLQKITLKL